MKNFVVGLLIGLSLTLGLSAAAQLYELRPATNEEEAMACGKAGGKGAFVVEINADGQPISEFTPFCLWPAKP